MPYLSKEDKLAAQRRWYQRNRDSERARIDQLRRDNREWFRALKAGLKCARCPESHPACLDFHHRDPQQKVITIGYAIYRRWSKTAILAEIAKCEVLCANCHRKETWLVLSPCP